MRTNAVRLIIRKVPNCNNAKVSFANKQQPTHTANRRSLTPDESVDISRHHSVALEVHRDGAAGMCKRRHLLARLPLPYPDAPVERGREQLGLVEAERAHSARVAAERAQLPARLNVPHLDGGVVRSGDEDVVFFVQLEAGDAVGVAPEHFDCASAFFPVGADQPSVPIDVLYTIFC